MNPGRRICGAGVVEAGVGGEVGGQPLRQRRQALHALGAVEERRCAGDHQVEPGKRPASSSSMSWRSAFERPCRGRRPACAAASRPRRAPGRARCSRRRAGTPAARQERQRSVVVEVALDAGGALDRRRHVRLAAEPGEQPIGGGPVAGVVACE